MSNDSMTIHLRDGGTLDISYDYETDHVIINGVRYVPSFFMSTMVQEPDTLPAVFSFFSSAHGPMVQVFYTHTVEIGEDGERRIVERRKEEA